MNFGAHGWIAWRRSATPAVVFGAMLPDLRTFLGDPLLALPDAVAFGVRLHRITDVVFHRDERFLAWTRAGQRALVAEQVGKGPRRAAAHAGLELVLDGCLLEAEPTLESALVSAMVVGRELAHLGTFPGDRWESFQLLFPGLLNAYRDESRLEERLSARLSRRSRLTPTAEERVAIQAWLRRLRSLVAPLARVWIAEIEDAVAREALTDPDEPGPGSSATDRCS